MMQISFSCIKGSASFNACGKFYTYIKNWSFLSKNRCATPQSIVPVYTLQRH